MNFENIWIVCNHPDSLEINFLNAYLKGHFHMQDLHIVDSHTTAYSDLGISNEDLLIITEENDPDKMLHTAITLRECFTDSKLLMIYRSRLSLMQLKIVNNIKNIALVNISETISEFRYCLEQVNSRGIIICRTTQSALLANIEYKSYVADTELNEKEKEIIRASKRGLTIKEISAEMNMSPNTIAAYRSKILKKTNTKSFFQLLAQHNESG